MEWFFSQIIQQHLSHSPDLVTAVSEKPFTYSELEKFSSIDEARQYLLDNKVEDVVRSGFSKWVAFLRVQLKLDMSAVEDLLPEVEEVFLRRNLLVHNGGIVNGTYVSKVDSNLLKKYKIQKDEALVTDRAYLESALIVSENFFLFVGASIWARHIKNDSKQIRDYFSTLNEISFDHLQAGRNRLAERLCSVLIVNKHISENERLYAKVNRWISLKYQDKLSEVRDEILGTDFSALDKIFFLAKYSLLDDYEGMYGIIPSVLQERKIDCHALKTWPLFKSARKKKKFRDLIESYEQPEGRKALSPKSKRVIRAKTAANKGNGKLIQKNGSKG